MSVTTQPYLKIVGAPEQIRDPDLPLPISERDAAWLAAVLDCEGWIGINASRSRSGALYHSKVGVGNTNPKLTARLLELTGCGYIAARKSTNPRAKPQWHWNVHRHGEVRAVLLTVLPHLVLKQEQAKLVLSLPGKHVKAKAVRESIHLQLRVLNRKGIAA